MAAGVEALALRGSGYLRKLLDDSDTRYELIDGCIVVSPVARLLHEKLVILVASALHQACPDSLVVVGSSYGVHYTGPEDDPQDETGSWFLPDVQVVREDAPELNNRTPALLVVEVLSPSTRWKDLGRKRRGYAEVGIPSYWLVEPETRELTVLTLTDGAYVETARGTRLELDLPFPVVIDLS